MNIQYRDAMYPDMSAGVIDTFPADICAISPTKDASCTVDSLEGYGKLTRGSFQIWSINGGHMDVLKAAPGATSCDLHDRVIADMLKRWENDELEQWKSDLRGLKQDQLFGRLPCKVSDMSFDKALFKAHDWV